MSSRISTTIGDHCTVTSSKRFHLSERSDYGVPFYCCKEIIQKVNGQQITECDFIREELYEQVKKQFGVPETGDLLITTRGTYGVPYIYRDTDKFYFADGNLTWLKDFDDELCPEYLFYWVRSSEGQGKIDAIAKGTAQKAVPIAAIKTLQLSLPSIEDQYRIVDVLSAYDALIENNQRQIKLLEEAAQRLYKEWFVDLHFPGYENVQIIDGVPEGWKKKCIGDLCVKTKSTVAPEDVLAGTPYIGLEHIPRHDFCLSVWGDVSDVNSAKALYKKNDIIFGQIRPYFHKVGFAINEGVASTDSFIMTPQKEIWGLFLLTVSSDAFVKYTSQTCKEGAKMPRADWDQMKNYPVLIADSKTQLAFERTIHCITEIVRALAMQNRALSEARDRLLPKLMSSEIEL